MRMRCCNCPNEGPFECHAGCYFKGLNTIAQVGNDSAKLAVVNSVIYGSFVTPAQLFVSRAESVSASVYVTGLVAQCVTIENDGSFRGRSWPPQQYCATSGSHRTRQMYDSACEWCQGNKAGGDNGQPFLASDQVLGNIVQVRTTGMRHISNDAVINDQ
jgi:hypothetical protein